MALHVKLKMQRFHALTHLSEGLTVVKQDGLCGYLNREGDLRGLVSYRFLVGATAP